MDKICIILHISIPYYKKDDTREGFIRVTKISPQVYPAGIYYVDGLLMDFSKDYLGWVAFQASY